MKNADKTHCPKGHPYSEGNTMVYIRRSTGRPIRKCATCKRERENSKPRPHAERAEAKRFWGKLWSERNPEKEAAYRKVYVAVRRGDLVRPACCEKCGKSGKDAIRIEASHNDYAKPLEVEWLCVWCHREKDRKYKLEVLSNTSDAT